MLRRISLSVLSLVLILIVVLLAHAYLKTSRQISVPQFALLTVDSDHAAASLSQAVQKQTVSSLDDPQANAEQFRALHAWLQQRYPHAHNVMRREIVGDFSLLYVWDGTDSKLSPILLMAHQDVVPIAPGTERDWKQTPFSGAIADGFVWGRGAWDDKGNLVSQMEAIEALAASGFQPKRTIYLAFGADEEVSGARGNAKIAALLKQRGVHLDFAIDEGMIITEGIFPGLKHPLALIGVAEKGYVSFKIGVSGTPGHSSMPPAVGTSTISKMSLALTDLEQHQFPAAVKGIAADMFDAITPELDPPFRIAMGNLWLFEPLLIKQLEKGPSSNALLRTTTALTIVQAGNKDNVLPGRADAVVNFRLLPGDTRASVEQHVRSQLDSVLGQSGYTLSRVEGSSEASKVAPSNSESYRMIESTVRELFPETVVAPGLMIGATDSRHYQDICEHIYKFSPVVAKPEDLERFHGTNERMSIKNLTELVQFYHRLLSRAAG